MQLSSVTRTDIGRKRQTNEDAYAAFDQLGFYAVADGMGGHAAGRLAADAGVAELVRRLCSRSQEPGPEALRLGFHAANATILEQALRDPNARGMGTTLATLWIREGRAILAHVGDSRIYLVRGPRMHLLTLDHAPVAEMLLRREISPEQARAHPGRNVINRAVGVRPWVEPDVALIPVEASDVFVLCTDGLTALVEDAEIERILRDCEENLELSAEVLIELANSRGGDDNSTVVLVRCLGG